VFVTWTIADTGIGAVIHQRVSRDRAVGSEKTAFRGELSATPEAIFRPALGFAARLTPDKSSSRNVGPLSNSSYRESRLSGVSPGFENSVKWWSDSGPQTYFQLLFSVFQFRSPNVSGHLDDPCGRVRFILPIGLLSECELPTYEPGKSVRTDEKIRRRIRRIG
jgi:hypothetical protein